MRLLSSGALHFVGCHLLGDIDEVIAVTNIKDLLQTRRKVSSLVTGSAAGPHVRRNLERERATFHAEQLGDPQKTQGFSMFSMATQGASTILYDQRHLCDIEENGTTARDEHPVCRRERVGKLDGLGYTQCGQP